MLLTVTSFSVSWRWSRAIFSANPSDMRADGFVLRLLDELPLIGDHGLDGPEEPCFLLLVQVQPLPHPLPQIGRRARRGCGGRRLAIVRREELGHSHLTLALHQGMCRRASNSHGNTSALPRAESVEKPFGRELGMLPRRSDGFRQRSATAASETDTAFRNARPSSSRACRSSTTITVTSSRLRLKSR